MANYSLFNPWGDYDRTFDDVFDELLSLYPLKPPECGYPPYFSIIDFSKGAYKKFLETVNVNSGDTLEIFPMVRRVLFQGVMVQIYNPAVGTTFTPVMNSPTTMDTVDASKEGSALYLPFGGVLDKNTSLADKQFIIQQPDYVGIKLNTKGAIEDLKLAITVVISNSFSGLEPTNMDFSWVPAA